MVIGNVFYFVMIFVLLKFMEKRERFNPKPFMVVYNFICVCLATYCFYGMLTCYFLKKPFLYCSDIDFDTENSKAIAHVGMVIKCDTVVRLYLLSAKVLGVYGYLLVHSP